MIASQKSHAAKRHCDLHTKNRIDALARQSDSLCEVPCVYTHGTFDVAIMHTFTFNPSSPSSS